MDDTDARVQESFAAFEKDRDPARVHEALNATVAAQRDLQVGDLAARKREIARWLRFFAALDRQIDRRWDSKILPVRNARLPPEHGIVFPSGKVDPATIPDVAQRARYDRELKENEDYARYYSAQFALRKIDERAMSTAGRLLAYKFTAAPADREEIETLLAESPASDERKERIRRLIPGEAR